MSQVRFEKLAAVWGGNIGEWPEADRSWATEFARQEAAARAILAEACELDAALTELGSMPPPAAPPALLAACAAAAVDLAAIRRRARRPVFAALVAAAAVGVALGASDWLAVLPGPAEPTALAEVDLVGETHQALALLEE